MDSAAQTNVRVVLVRPRRGGNVGSVARAMKNMGLSDLVLVAPRTPVGASAAHMAAHAGDVLRGRRTVPDLATALRDIADDLTALRTAFVGLTAKIDADAGDTGGDNDYAETLDPAALKTIKG